MDLIVNAVLFVIVSFSTCIKKMGSQPRESSLCISFVLIAFLHMQYCNEFMVLSFITLVAYGCMTCLCASSTSDHHAGQETLAVTDEDLEHLCNLLQVKDGGPAWHQVMDRSTPTMCYQAWRRDPEVGPPQYRSRTVYEDVAPELMRDFFWDDEFRLKWDDMLLYTKTLEECQRTGTMIIHWVRKVCSRELTLPLVFMMFCSVLLFIF
jgi:hypothetical protein